MDSIRQPMASNANSAPSTVQLEYHVAPNFRGWNFHLIAKNHMNVTFVIKISWLLRFFVITSTPWRPRGQFTLSLRPYFLHVALGLVWREKNRNNTELFQNLILRQRLSICLDALCRRDERETSTFVIHCCERLDVTGTRTYMLVLTICQRTLALAVLHST